MPQSGQNKVKLSRSIQKLLSQLDMGILILDSKYHIKYCNKWITKYSSKDADALRR